MSSYSTTSTIQSEMGVQMLEVANKILELLAQISGDIQDLQFLKVFVEVMTAFGKLAKTGSASKKIQETLNHMSSYASVLPYFLTTKAMLAYLQRVVHSTRSPTPRLQRVQVDLEQISAMTRGVARNLENLGNYLLEIIKDQHSVKELVEEFNETFDSIYSSLQNCVSDLQKVKVLTDGELRSARGTGVQLNAAESGIQIFSLAAMIIGPFVVGFLGMITAYSVSDAVGTGSVAGGSTAFGAASQLWSAYKNVEEMKERFSSHYTWEIMDNKLKVLNDDLQALKTTRDLNVLVSAITDFFS